MILYYKYDKVPDPEHIPDWNRVVVQKKRAPLILCQPPNARAEYSTYHEHLNLSTAAFKNTSFYWCNVHLQHSEVSNLCDSLFQLQARAGL
jgi:hypothetical protein